MFEFLKQIGVFQEARVKRYNVYRKTYRVNPYNPLSYVVIALSAVIIFLVTGPKNASRAVREAFEWT